MSKWLLLHKKSLIEYAIPYWRRLLLVLILSLISTGLSLVIPFLSKDLFDRALLGRDFHRLLIIVALFTGITLVSFLLNVVTGLRYTRTSAEILFDMRLSLYQHLQRLSPRFYARTRLGEIVSRINNDIAEIQRVAAETALAWIGNVLFLIGTVVAMLLLDARLFLLTIALLPVSIWTLVHYRKRLEGKVTDVRQSSADIGSFLIETLQGVKLVVTSNAQQREEARFRQKNDKFIRALMSMQVLSYFSGGLPGLILSVSTALVFLYGGRQVILGAITPGTFIAFLSYAMRLFPPIQALMGLYTNLATARVSLGRVGQIFDTSPEVVEAPNAISLPRVRGDVDFEEVSLSFDRNPVLDRVSFSVRAGETLAIVGSSGSGKSTIADLLLRMLEPDGGVVRLDGNDLRGVRLADLRRQVVLVEQEPFVFHTSIAENLRYAFPNASQRDLEEAARAAGIDSFIRNLPQQYETTVGERGMALSAGERQRIALARAFLADPAVLVLDEPTASLDPVSERQVIAGYEAIMQGRTTILISHRLELASQADRVIVLDGARIVESGTPSELRIKQGSFAKLFNTAAVAP
ncbi:MAG TPA: ABC transporter ATP-binding protein [Bryobacteraceae bacterium]|nr:ABC transporter ATP-binding protein [Bryobacteraceae bacterium]